MILCSTHSVHTFKEKKAKANILCHRTTDLDMITGCPPLARTGVSRTDSILKRDKNEMKDKRIFLNRPIEC